MRPISGRGLLFLVAFLSLLSVAFLGPHVHGADPVPALPGSVSAAGIEGAEIAGGGVADAMRVAASAAATSPAATWLQGDGDPLGFAAVCVLVLLLTFALFAARAAPRRARARRSSLLQRPFRLPAPRAPARPLFALLSISRT